MRISTQRRSLIAGICTLLLSQSALADQVIPVGVAVAMLAFFLLVTGGVGAIYGNVCAARGLSPWRGLRYLWAGIFLLIYGLSLTNQYEDFLLPESLITTAVFALPITLSALFFHSWRRRRIGAATPKRETPSLSRWRLVVEGVLLLLVATSMTVAQLWHKHVLPEQRWQEMCENFSIDGLRVITSEEPAIELTLHGKRSAYVHLIYLELTDVQGKRIAIGNNYNMSVLSPGGETTERIKMDKPIDPTPTFVELELCDTDASPSAPCVQWAFGHKDGPQETKHYCIQPPPALPANFMN